MSRHFDKQKWKDILRLLKKGVRHLFLHNGWVKLLAVLISVALWAGLISQDPNVIRNKNFQNVYIEIEGQEDLKKKGRIVTTDLDELLGDVSMTVAVPQLQYEDASASAYELKIDLSGIQSVGEQEIRIQSKNDTVYGEVVNIIPSTINVMVEDYITYQKVPITIRTEGEAPEGWYITQLAVEPQTVSVSGPLSLVKELSRGIVTLDLTAQKWEEGTFRAIGEIKLLNLKGEEINNPLLTISSGGYDNDIVIIQAEMLPTREYNLREMIRLKGEPAEGYRITGEPEFSKETITVAAGENTLRELDELSPLQLGNKILESQELDVSGLTETKVFTLKTNTLDDVKFVQLSGGTVSVTVTIEGTEEPQTAVTDSEETG